MSESAPKNLSERTWPWTLVGIGLLVVANTVSSCWSGFYLNVFAGLLLVPIVWVAVWIIRGLGNRLNWQAKSVTLVGWISPSVFLIVLGFYESRPATIFQKHLFGPIPPTISRLEAQRIVGMDGWVGIYLEGDSNAVAQIIAAKNLRLETNLFHLPNNREAEQSANRQIAARATFLKLPTNYLRKPFQYESMEPHGQVPSALHFQMWVEEDWKRAYIFF